MLSDSTSGDARDTGVLLSSALLKDKYDVGQRCFEAFGISKHAKKFDDMVSVVIRRALAADERYQGLQEKYRDYISWRCEPLLCERPSRRRYRGPDEENDLASKRFWRMYDWLDMVIPALGVSVGQGPSDRKFYMVHAAIEAAVIANELRD